MANFFAVLIAMPTSAQDAKVNYAMSYDQAALRWETITNPSSGLSLWHVPSLELINDANAKPQFFSSSAAVSRTKQKEIYLKNNRPFYLGWDPDYLSFRKTMQAHYGKSETEQLAALCPADNPRLYGRIERQFDGLNEFEKRRILARQKEVITELWHNAKPIAPNADVVYILDASLGNYDFDKQVFPVGEFNIYGCTNKNGEKVAARSFCGSGLSDQIAYVLYGIRSEEAVIFTFNGKFGAFDIPMSEASAEKLRSDLKNEPGAQVICAMHGNLIFDDSIVASAKCGALTAFRTGNVDGGVSSEPDPSQCYMLNVKWVDCYRASARDKVLYKLTTLKF